MTIDNYKSERFSQEAIGQVRRLGLHFDARPSFPPIHFIQRSGKKNE